MSKRRYWIGVASGEHVQNSVERGTCMLTDSGGGPAEEQQEGDWLVYYSPRERIREGEEIQAFTAIGKIAQTEWEEKDLGSHGTGFVRPIEYEDVQKADIHPLIDDLAFIENRDHWGAYFRSSPFEVSREDMKVIAMSMGVDGRKF